jgi:hypothetical protein
VRADTAQEVLADLFVREVELDLDDTHRLGTHHLLNKPERQGKGRRGGMTRSDLLDGRDSKQREAHFEQLSLRFG